MKMLVVVMLLLAVGVGLGYGVYLIVDGMGGGIPPFDGGGDVGEYIDDYSYFFDSNYFGSSGEFEGVTTSISTYTEYTSTVDVAAGMLPPDQQPMEVSSGFCKSIYGYVPCFTYDENDCRDSGGDWDTGADMCTCQHGYRYENFTMNRHRCDEIPPQELCDASGGLWISGMDCERGFDPDGYTCTLLPYEYSRADTCDCRDNARSILQEKKQCLEKLTETVTINKDLGSTGEQEYDPETGVMRNVHRYEDRRVRNKKGYLACISSVELEDRGGGGVWRDHWGCVEDDDFLTVAMWRVGL